MKHNNAIPKNHFRKHWQTRVKTWFDQPGKKASRRAARAKKTAESISSVSKLKPAVRCPTLKYNTKLRTGRGFTLTELKAVGLSRQYAKTIGISVDHRRKNRSEESLNINVQRIKLYLSKLAVLPKGAAKPAERSAEANVVFAVKNVKSGVQTAELTEAIKKVPVYATLRKAWGQQRHSGIRAKRAAAKAEEAANTVAKTK